MASPTCSWLQQFANLGIGAGEVAALRVDAIYINAMGTDIIRANAERASHGDKAVDAGSAAGRCSVSLRSDSNRTGVIKNGDWYKVTELATGSVWTGTAQADDVIAFGTLPAGFDGILREGVAPGNYAAPAFIDDLRIEIRHQLHSSTQAQELNLDEASAGGLDTAVIERPGGAILETDIAASEVSYAIGHNLGTGAHNDGVIDEATFADTAFENFNYANLLANGGAEVGHGAVGDGLSYADNLPFYWSGVAGRLPTNGTYITSAQVYEGRHSCIANYGAANQAVDLEFDPLEFDVTQHVNKWVALTVAVRATVADSITVGFNGAVGPEDQSAAGGNAGAWTIMTHVMQINGGETGLTVRLVNTFAGGNVTYFDAAITVLGTKPVGFKRSRWEDGALEARHVSVYNLAINHLFSYWTNGVAADPDTWTSLGTCVTIQNAANYARGHFSAAVTLPDNAGTLRHTLGYSPANRLAEGLRNRFVTAKFQVLWHTAGTKNLHVTLRSNVGGNSVTEIIDLVSCQPNFVPCAVIALEVDAAATDVYLEFENLDAGAGQITFYLDDVQITATPWPCAPVIPNYFEIETETWGYNGTCDASLGAVDLFRAGVGNWGTNLGHQLGFFGVPLRAYAEANGGPAAAVTTFTLLVNGAGFSTVAITNPATAGMAHTNVPGAWGLILPTDFIRVEATVGSTAVDDPVVRWVILKSAANTSEV